MTLTAFSLEPVSASRRSLWTLSFDLPGEKVNKLDSRVLAEFPALLTRLEAMGREGKCEALLLVSGKPDHFVAGADIALIQSAKDAGEATKLSQTGQAFLNRFEDLPFLKIALIEGAALGGGCEFALACDAILASNSPAVKIGLPEVMLGLLPGMGGCVRLPQRLGYAQALDLILNGKSLSGDSAATAGLAVASLPKEDFRGNALRWIDANFDRLKAARARGGRLAREPKLGGMGGMMGKLLESVGKPLMFSKARSAVLSRTRGKYPAPLEILDVIRSVSPAYGERMSAGKRDRALAREAEGFGKLAATPVSKNLIRLFFLTEEVKKSNGLPAGAPAPAKMPVRVAAVLGAGVMGGGIAQLFADRGIPIRMKDLNDKALELGMQSARAVFQKALKRRKLTPRTMTQKMAAISPTLTFDGFGAVDLTIEAVIEKMDIKKKVLQEAEASVRSDALIATNTSSLSVTEMQTVLRHPGRFLGMHFFNPVHKMPLVEVIRGPQTTDEATAALFDLCKKLGKTPVVVKDGPGFLVNRLLAPYLNEAAYLVLEGVPIGEVDEALLDFGMPMGPLELIDEVGVDVGEKVGHILEDAFGGRMKAAPMAGMLVKAGRLGKKNQKGIFSYEAPGGKGKRPAPEVYGILGVQPKAGGVKASEIVDRCILPMVNEAALCLEEGIAASASDVDLGMIFGTGFPPFRGGLMRFADDLGAAEIVKRLEALTAKHGERYAPSAPLGRLASSGGRFHGAR